MENKPIKLMIVTPYFYPKIGGLENYAFNIAKGLKKNYNYEIIVVTSNHEDKIYKEETIEGMKIYRLPYQFKVSNTPISFNWKKQIKDIIEKEKPDVINAHSPVPFISDVTARIANKLKIPFYLTYHAGSMKKGIFYLDWIISIYENIFLKKTLNLSTKVFPVSEYVKVQFPKEFQSKCIVIPNFINKNNITDTTPKKKKNQLIFISSLDKSHIWKGLDDVIKSINIYKNQFNNKIRLIIIGDGDYKTSYETLVRELKLEQEVIFAGAKFGKEKDKIIQESEALIFYTKTTSDAFPTVFLEAWANKTPIISANIGPAPYLIEEGKTGVLVEANNPEKLAFGLNNLLKNSELRKNLIQNGSIVVNNFTLDKQIEKMNKIIVGGLR